LAGTLSAKSKAVIVRDFAMKTFLAIFCCIFFAMPFTVYAHGLSLFSQEKKLIASYSDHSPAAGADVILADVNGVIIFQDKTDEKGMWKLPENLETIPFLIIVEDSTGHREKITWEEFLKGHRRGFFDLSGIRVIIGVVAIISVGYTIQRILLKKRT